MVFLLSLTALVLSYLINKRMLRLFRENAVIFGAPVFEELFKTLPAYFLNRSVLHVHLLFGLGEALYDFFTGKRESGRWAAWASLISHSLFGVITYWILDRNGKIFPALAAAILSHCAWNFTIMRIGRKE